jgi:uracil-DNA glycosylase
VRYYQDHRGHDDPRTPTNKNLVYLLSSIGITIAPPNPADSGGGSIFLTNAILCHKTNGGLQGAVMRQWFENCARRFLRPTIELVQPKAVITLGEWAWQSMRLAYELPRRGLRAAVEIPDGMALPGGMRLFPMYHPGQRVLNTKIRTWDQQVADWGRVARQWTC